MSHFALFPFSFLRREITGCLELSHVTKDICGSNTCARAAVAEINSFAGFLNWTVFGIPRVLPIFFLKFGVIFQQHQVSQEEFLPRLCFRAFSHWFPKYWTISWDPRQDS